VALPVPVQVIVTIPVVFVCRWFAKAFSTFTVTDTDTVIVIAVVIVRFANHAESSARRNRHPFLTFLVVDE
jgi:Ca2+/H+ antiporter